MTSRRYGLRIARLALLFVFFTHHPAAAQEEDGSDAVMAASAFRPIPGGSRIALVLADDTDINLRLRDVAERALHRAGYVVVNSEAAFTLRLETEHLDSGTRVDTSIGSLRAGSGVGSPTGNDAGPRGTGVDLNVRLWSSTRNSLLNPKSAGTGPRQGFGVKLEAFDELARKPAWHGAARTDDTGGDSFHTGSVMIRRLIEVLGTSVEAEPLPLQ